MELGGCEEVGFESRRNWMRNRGRYDQNIQYTCMEFSKKTNKIIILKTVKL